MFGIELNKNPLFLLRYSLYVRVPCLASRRNSAVSNCLCTTFATLDFASSELSFSLTKLYALLISPLS